MANLNKVLLIGRLTRDPEFKYIPSGAAVAEFGLAVNRTYVVQGERREDTCFVDITVWGRQAEITRDYLSKGRQVFVDGHLVFDQWQTKEGQKRSRLRVTADNVQFLDSQRSGDGGGRQGGGGYQGGDRQQGGYEGGGQQGGGYQGGGFPEGSQGGGDSATDFPEPDTPPGENEVPF